MTISFEAMRKEGVESAMLEGDGRKWPGGIAEWPGLDDKSA